MTQALLPLCMVGALVAALLCARASRGWVGGGLVPGLLVAGASLVLAVSSLQRPIHVPEAQVEDRPNRLAGRGYVSSTACRACHAREHATWHESYHRSMTQVDVEDIALGDFDDVTLERHGQTFALSRRDDGLWIRMRDPLVPTGGTVDRRVVMSTGSHHMQLYWYASGFGRVVGLLPFAFLIDEQRWIPRLSAFLLAPSHDISPEFGNWNQTCQRCHATGPVSRLDMDLSGLRGADTFVAEHGIACEACHGPGAAHVAANQNPVRRYGQHLSETPDPTMVNPARLPHDRGSQVCGQCHGNFDDTRSGKALEEWFQNGFSYRPGDDLGLTRPLLKDGGDTQYWPDGMIRVSGREFNGLSATPCFIAGQLSCFSCHVMHRAADDPRTAKEWAEDQLKPGMRGDQACLQCHASYAADVTAHTHHAPGSSGSGCLDCHMPHTSYGLLKAIRNHQVTSPDAVNALATGRITACNQCHVDRSLAWVSERLTDWYGIASPAPEALARAEASPGVSATVAYALTGDAAQRAFAAWSLGWPTALETSGRDWMAPTLIHLLDDPYEAVRIIALRSLRRLPGFADFAFDELAPEAQRRVGQNAARALWDGARHATPSQPASVLLRPDGTVDQAVFDRLARLRNERPVNLLE